jgi:valyl-tRNA synthetase
MPHGAAGNDVAALEFASTVLGAIRKKKSEEQRPLKTPVARAVITAPHEQLELLPLVEHDLRASGLIREIETRAGDTLLIDVELAAPEPAQEKAT